MNPKDHNLRSRKVFGEMHRTARTAQGMMRLDSGRIWQESGMIRDKKKRCRLSPCFKYRTTARTASPAKNAAEGSAAAVLDQIRLWGMRQKARPAA